MLGPWSRASVFISYQDKRFIGNLDIDINLRGWNKENAASTMPRLNFWKKVTASPSMLWNLTGKPLFYRFCDSLLSLSCGLIVKC